MTRTWTTARSMRVAYRRRGHRERSKPGARPHVDRDRCRTQGSRGEAASDTRQNVKAGLRAGGARDPLLANLETAAPPIATRGLPIGVPVALWRELGCYKSPDAIVVEVASTGRWLWSVSTHRDTGLRRKGIVTNAATRRALRHGLRSLVAAGGLLLQPGDAQARALAAGGGRRAIASLRHRSVPRPPERSSAPGRPRDRNGRNAIASSHATPAIAPPRNQSRFPRGLPRMELPDSGTGSHAVRSFDGRPDADVAPPGHPCQACSLLTMAEDCDNFATSEVTGTKAAYLGGMFAAHETCASSAVPTPHAKSWLRTCCRGDAAGRLERFAQ
jgi:hypothetical protein